MKFLLSSVFQVLFILTCQAQYTPKPWVSSLNNKLLRDQLRVNTDDQLFSLYRIDVESVSFSFVTIDEYVQYPGEGNRCYNFDLAIYDIKGASIINFQSDGGIKEDHPAGYSKIQTRAIIRLNQEITLKKGDYYFAIYPKEEEGCKLGNAILYSYKWQCHDEHYDELPLAPACILRNITVEDRLLPNWIPNTIFTNIEDNSHKYHRNSHFKPFVITLWKNL